MKKIFLSLLLLIASLLSFSQTTIGDIIYPQNSSTPITGIDIIEVYNGNHVKYTKDGEELSIMAIAIKQDGKYINLRSKIEKEAKANVGITNDYLYNGYDLKYYQDIQTKNLKRKTGGKVTTIIGIGASIVGSVMIESAGFDEETETFRSPTEAKVGAVLGLAGIITTLVGIPNWVTGVKRFNKAQKGIDHFNSLEKNASLSVGTTPNGLGLVLKF
jgi:hypothetical protein